MDGALAEREAPSPDVDEHAWLLHQAAACRSGRVRALDTDNLARYLEYMAKREVREVESRIRVLLSHMLKFRLQPERAGRSWALSVVNAQHELAQLLESASLRREALAAYDQAWQKARRSAATETELPLSTIPESNPWTLDEAMVWEPPVGLTTLRPRPRRKADR